MHVQIPQARHHAHAFRGNNLRSFRDLKFADLSDRLDPLVLDYYNAVLERLSAKSIDEGAANKGFYLGKSRVRCNQQDEGEQEAHGFQVWDRKNKENRGSAALTMTVYRVVRPGPSPLGPNVS
jgi:hypothetical protein